MTRPPRPSTMSWIAVLSLCCGCASADRPANVPAAVHSASTSPVETDGGRTWAAEDRAAAAHVLELASGTRTLTLDLSDPKTAHFLGRQFESGGLTRGRYPGLYSLIDEHANVHARRGVTRPRAQALSDDLLYIDLATLMLAIFPVSQTSFTGNAAASFANTAEDPSQNLQIVYASLCFYDENNNLVGTCTAQSSFGSGQYFPVHNTVTTSVDELTGVFSATYYDTSSQRYIAQLSTLQLDTLEYPSMQTITDPVILHSQNNSLQEALVCTSRSVNTNANPGICDYGNYQTSGVLVSMGGSVTYQSNQSPLTSNGVLVGTGSVSLINTDSGGQCTLSPSISGTNFFSQPQVSYNATTKTVSWDFDNLDFGSTTSLLCGGDGTDIQFSLVLQVEDSAADDVTIVASQYSIAGTIAPHFVGTNAGALATPVLALVAGCLHPETRVEMADGSTHVIAEFKGEGELVRSLGGITTHVVGTTVGDEPKLFRIVAKGNQEVLASANHPFVTTAGDLIAASDLKAGDRVLGRDGPLTISSVAEVSHGGRVYNLLLGPSPEVLHDEATTFYANGFLVGAHDAQQRLAKATRAEPQRVEALLPERFRVDYASHLEDRRRRAHVTPGGGF